LEFGTEFWRRAMVVAPLAALVITPTAVSLMGGFKESQWVGENVSALTALGILGTMCFPPRRIFLREKEMG
jgi:hypothetical protein